MIDFLIFFHAFMTRRRETPERIPAEDAPLVQGGQGREPSSLVRDADLVTVCLLLAVVFMFVATCTGCIPTPNALAPENDLRSLKGSAESERSPSSSTGDGAGTGRFSTHPSNNKVARADPNYIAPAPERNDPSEPRWAYPQSVPYRGRETVTAKVEQGNEADAKTESHYTKGAP